MQLFFCIDNSFLPGEVLADQRLHDASIDAREAVRIAECLFVDFKRAKFPRNNFILTGLHRCDLSVDDLQLTVSLLRPRHRRRAELCGQLCGGGGGIAYRCGQPIEFGCHRRAKPD